MSELSPDVIAMLQYLVPGFIAAGIFYATTAHAKPSQFERMVQALILTVVVRAALVAEQAVAHSIGRIFSMGSWTADSTLVASIVTALVLGLSVSIATNRDVVHRWLRRFGVTFRSAHPSEWFAVFSQRQRFVTLTLKVARDSVVGRAYGRGTREKGTSTSRRVSGSEVNALSECAKLRAFSSKPQMSRISSL